MTCPHLRWKIETPNGGPLLRGVCQDCGAEGTFRATLDEMNWDQAAKARLRVMEQEREGVA